MSEIPPEQAPPRLVDESRDELVISGLLALREDGPSERSRQGLLAELGLEAQALPIAAAPPPARSWQRLRSAALGLLLGIVLGLAWALYRRYAQ